MNIWSHPLGRSLFWKPPFRDYEEAILVKLEKEINSKGAQYCLEMDRGELIEYFVKTHSLIPLTLFTKNIRPYFRGRRKEEVSGKEILTDYLFDLVIPFNGTSELFFIQPNPYGMNTYKGSIRETEGYAGELVYDITTSREDKNEFIGLKDQFLAFVNLNVTRINENVRIFNDSLAVKVERIINILVSADEKERSFLKEIGVEVNQNTTEIFQIPKVKIPVIREPKPVNISLRDDPEYSVPEAFFTDVCSIINKVLKDVERKPSIYSGKSEQDIRDYILPVIETRYEGISATGETFNKEGKTDILIRLNGQNLFIAECKHWGGSKTVTNAIDQLFQKYITWRDTKVALIIFVKLTGFTEVVRQIPQILQSHELFVSDDGKQDEAVFDYSMHFPGDSLRHIHLKVMLYHFPKT